MKKLFALCMALLLLVPALALAEGKLTITQDSLIMLTDISGWYFARVENTGDAPALLEAGALTFFGEDGAEVHKIDYISTNLGNVELKPGQYAYISRMLWEDPLKDVKVAKHSFVFADTPYGTPVKTIPGEVKLQLKALGDSENNAFVTFTNPTSEVLYYIEVVVAITDEAGKLVSVAEHSNLGMGVHPGTAVTVMMRLENDLLTALKDAGTDMTKLKADALIAYHTPN
ncbi:MAG: hypothetical protein GXZ04_02240 [Clostridiales bacterium]|nr:hypothetical protein [Clostridiales bacterium]